jgi:hypothetical protein
MFSGGSVGVFELAVDLDSSCTLDRMPTTPCIRWASSFVESEYSAFVKMITALPESGSRKLFDRKPEITPLTQKVISNLSGW